MHMQVTVWRDWRCAKPAELLISVPKNTEVQGLDGPLDGPDTERLIKLASQYYCMVVKFVNEVRTGQSASQGLPRILYSGTTDRYLEESLRQNGQFMHVMEQPVYLTEHDLTALSVAGQRALFYDEDPMLLIVDTDKLEGELRYDGSYKIEGLNVGSFVPHRFALSPDGYIDRSIYGEIEHIAARLQDATREDIEQDVKRFLLGST